MVNEGVKALRDYGDIMIVDVRGNRISSKPLSKRTWIKPGGQQILLNTLPETEKGAWALGFIPHDKRTERPDIDIRVERINPATDERMGDGYSK